ncbi:MAG: hypothetical protein QOJ79_2679 [Actinomycetota bacterium]|jgi:hypothetical protein|nr:hypothetical protein [Actinomycetota bacterium]
MRRVGRLSILYLLMAVAGVACALVGFARGHVGPAAVGIPLALFFGTLSFVTSKAGVERGYYRLPYRLLTFGKGKAIRHE